MLKTVLAELAKQRGPRRAIPEKAGEGAQACERRTSANKRRKGFTVKVKTLAVVAVALFLAVVVTACEPTVALDASLKGWPYCPTTPTEFVAADSVPLGCPVPEVSGP